MSMTHITLEETAYKPNGSGKRSKPLTDKQQAFIEAYTSGVTRRNATQSSILAGYSAHTANKIANGLLHDPRIQHEIQSRFNYTFETWKQVGVDAVNELDKNSANRVRYWEIIGKSMGYIRDNTLTVNNLYQFNADDMAKLRQTVQAELSGAPISISGSGQVDSPKLIDNAS